MDSTLNQEQFSQIIGRLDRIEENAARIESKAVTKHDVFQSVLTVQTAFFAVIVGTIVVLNSIGMFG